MTPRTTTKETVMGRIYAVTVGETVHEVLATSPAELAEQLQTLTGNTPLARMTKLSFDNDDMSITVGEVSVVSVGCIVRRLWRVASVVRAPRRRARKMTEAAPAEPADAVRQAEDDPLAALFGSVTGGPQS